jgi:hypothetical protein
MIPTVTATETATASGSTDTTGAATDTIGAAIDTTGLHHVQGGNFL